VRIRRRVQQRYLALVEGEEKVLVRETVSLTSKKRTKGTEPPTTQKKNTPTERRSQERDFRTMAGFEETER